MLEIFQRLVSFHWRWRGARMRAIRILGSRVWYAEFNPRRADVDALRRAARARGENAPRGFQPPTIVLFHGLGASSTSFYPVIPHLTRMYRVVIPDLPGNGWSRPPRGRAFLPFREIVDVAERFVSRVAPRGAYVAGNSMGGWIAAKIAARRPELVRGMALLNPGGPALRAQDWVDFARVLWAEGQTDEWFSRMFHRTPFGMRLFARDFKRIMHGPSVAQVIQALRPEDFLTEQELERVRCPSVLIWGERDRLIPDGCKAFYLRKLKGVRYEPVPDCGHCPQLECPHRTAQILLQLPSLAAHRASADAAPKRPGGAGERAGTPIPRRRGAVTAVARAPRTSANGAVSRRRSGGDVPG
jgi:pimeloyl-ACP methyl ester carboxylesterase